MNISCKLKKNTKSISYLYPVLADYKVFLSIYLPNHQKLTEKSTRYHIVLKYSISLAFFWAKKVKAKLENKALCFAEQSRVFLNEINPWLLLELVS